MAKIAVKGTEYEALAEKMTGPIALAFGFEDPVSPAKAVVKFIKESKKGAIVGAVLEGKLMTEAETRALAELPSKEELYAKMLGSINSPASGIVGSINAVMAQLTRAMAAVRDQKAAYFCSTIIQAYTPGNVLETNSKNIKEKNNECRSNFRIN